jgi:phosphotransferase system IIB component
VDAAALARAGARGVAQSGEKQRQVLVGGDASGIAAAMARLRAA